MKLCWLCAEETEVSKLFDISVTAGSTLCVITKLLRDKCGSPFQRCKRIPCCWLKYFMLGFSYFLSAYQVCKRNETWCLGGCRLYDYGFLISRGDRFPWNKKTLSERPTNNLFFLLQFIHHSVYNRNISLKKKFFQQVPQVSVYKNTQSNIVRSNIFLFVGALEIHLFNQLTNGKKFYWGIIRNRHELSEFLYIR